MDVIIESAVIFVLAGVLLFLQFEVTTDTDELDRQNTRLQRDLVWLTIKMIRAKKSIQKRRVRWQIKKRLNTNFRSKR